MKASKAQNTNTGNQLVILKISFNCIIYHLCPMVVCLLIYWSITISHKKIKANAKATKIDYK